MNRRSFLSNLLALTSASFCPELLLDLLKPRKVMIVVPEWRPRAVPGITRMEMFGNGTHMLIRANGSVVWQIHLDQHSAYQWIAMPGGEIVGQVDYKFEPIDTIDQIHAFEAHEKLADNRLVSWGEKNLGQLRGAFCVTLP